MNWFFFWMSTMPAIFWTLSHGHCGLKFIKPRNRIGNSSQDFFGDFLFLFIIMPKDAISSNFGLASLSAGVCCSQKALFRTWMLVPPGPFSWTVSIFMCRPASRPQVTWKAAKQEFLWHWIQAPLVPLVLHIRQGSFHLKQG